MPSSENARQEIATLRAEFNPFLALRTINRESTHATFLRWLLDPSEKHELGTSFADALFAGQRGCAHALPESFEVRSELQVAKDSRLDLLIRSEADGFTWVLELKTRSSDGREQLARYRRECEKTYSGTSCPEHHWYVTPFGVTPLQLSEIDAWRRISYADILDAIESIRPLRDDRQDEFVGWYVAAVARHVTHTHRIRQLCRSLRVDFEDEAEQDTQRWDEDNLLSLIASSMRLWVSSQGCVAIQPISLKKRQVHLMWTRPSDGTTFRGTLWVDMQRYQHLQIRGEISKERQSIRDTATIASTVASSSELVAALNEPHLELAFTRWWQGFEDKDLNQLK